MNMLTSKTMVRITLLFLYSMSVSILFKKDKYLSKNLQIIKDELIHKFNLLNDYSILMIGTLLTLAIFSYGLINNKFTIIYDIFLTEPSLLLHVFILVIVGVITSIIMFISMFLLSFIIHYICIRNLLIMVPIEHSFEYIGCDTYQYIVADKSYINLFKDIPESVWMADLLVFYRNIALHLEISIEYK